MDRASARTLYEDIQDFNRLARYLHSGRYTALLKLMGELRRDIAHRPIRALDIGCGPGTSVAALLDAFRVDYTGIDNDPDFITAARLYHGQRANCRFIEADAADPSHYRANSADIVYALEAFEHIPENRVVRIVENVCHIVRPRLFVVTVPVEVGPAVWIKNWGSALMGYKRHSGDFRETLWAGFYQLDRVPTHQTSHLGFDWRWLAQTMRHNAPIREITGLPFRFLPKSVAPTVLMVAEPCSARA